jgi:hypothetical protein
VKGELEAAVAALGYGSAVAFRPSLLSGDRRQNRPGERVALAVLQRLRFLVPRRYRPIFAGAVAQAMLDRAKRGRAGFSVIESDAMLAAEERARSPAPPPRRPASGGKRR